MHGHLNVKKKKQFGSLSYSYYCCIITLMMNAKGIETC